MTLAPMPPAQRLESALADHEDEVAQEIGPSSHRPADDALSDAIGRAESVVDLLAAIATHRQTVGFAALDADVRLWEEADDVAAEVEAS